MTWRVCSPPWPGRENPGSWPGRRQCGLPSAGLPLRSASHPLPGDQYGTDDPGGLELRSRARLATALVVDSGRAGQRPGGLHGLCCPAPFSRWPTSRWRRRPRIALARYRPPRHRECDTSCHAPADQPPGPRPSHSAGHRAAPQPLVDAEDAPFADPLASVRSCPTVDLQPRSGELAEFRRRGIGPSRPPGPRSSPARASSRGPRASPPAVRSLPDLRSDRDDRGVDRRDLVGADGTAPGHADIAVG